ncbi:fibronectin type III domain-containing protein [uncultured Eubacterium sp.]|uniref:fibronectin type III domain-containing protein n=1 Tax=uncultured Eubacterium sp. TaxID=165185 RepID=UPI0025E21288|nr:fibronectin type III domain-containing protein [uncultured Eubacterium sp.]
MKKLISGILSVAVLATSMLGFASTAQAATTNITIPAGQRMTYIRDSGNQYVVRLYTEQGSGKYAPTTQVKFGTQTATASSGIIGYINKTDVDTTYFGGNYGRPWTNPYDSIVYGAKYIADNYYDHQYTLYFQKFNAEYSTSNVQFTHEYMTNIRGAADEAKILYNGYSNAGLLESPHTFYIPVYLNIPGDNGNYSTASYPEFTGKYAHDIADFARMYGGTNYTFKAVNTGLTFDQAVAAEMKANPRALKTDVEKYLNPLNFLTLDGVFQFESLKKEDCDKMSPDANAPKNLVNGILKGSWMENKDITYTTTEGSITTYTTGSGTTLKNATYTDAIIAASTTNGWGVNYIATKIRQENGLSYGSAITGTTAPFQGIYNFFNIGANNTASDGLAFAAGYMKAKTNTTLYYTNATITQAQPTTTKPVTTTKNYTPAKVKLVSLTAKKSGHKIVVKWNKCTTSATGYQIVWARDKKFKKISAKKTITGRRYKSYTGKNFTKGRKYYVRIRAYKKAGGRIYYGPWSNIKAKTAK